MYDINSFGQINCCTKRTRIAIFLFFNCPSQMFDKKNFSFYDAYFLFFGVGVEQWKITRSEKGKRISNLMIYNNASFIIKWNKTIFYSFVLISCLHGIKSMLQSEYTEYSLLFIISRKGLLKWI